MTKQEIEQRLQVLSKELQILNREWTALQRKFEVLTKHLNKKRREHVELQLKLKEMNGEIEIIKPKKRGGPKVSKELLEYVKSLSEEEVQRILKERNK